MILQHVDERIANLPRAFQITTVPAIGPEATASVEQAVHPARDAHHQATDARRQRIAVVALHNQMHMIVLHRIMHDAKPISIAVAQPSEERAGHLLSSQRTAARPQREMYRVRLAMHGPHAMRSPPQMRGSRLATRATACTPAPLRQRERERQLIGTHEYLALGQF